jgi:plasmid replication initiation protein
MAKKFSELQAKMSPESQARSAARAEAMLVEIQLKKLHKAYQMLQVDDAINIEQAVALKTEHSDNMYITTLREYIKALGGELKLVASFPDVDIQLHPFELAH